MAVERQVNCTLIDMIILSQTAGSVQPSGCSVQPNQSDARRRSTVARAAWLPGIAANCARANPAVPIAATARSVTPNQDLRLPSPVTASELPSTADRSPPNAVSTGERIGIVTILQRNRGRRLYPAAPCISRRCGNAYSAAFTLSAVIGSERTRAPEAAKIALAIAGATEVTAGSPQPTGYWPVSIRITSRSGTFSMRHGV